MDGISMCTVSRNGTSHPEKFRSKCMHPFIEAVKRNPIASGSLLQSHSLHMEIVQR